MEKPFPILLKFPSFIHTLLDQSRVKVSVEKKYKKETQSIKSLSHLKFKKL